MRAPSGVCHGDGTRIVPSLPTTSIWLRRWTSMPQSIVREHVAREAQHAGEARVDALAAEHLLAAHALRLGAGDQRARALMQ